MMSDQSQSASRASQLKQRFLNHRLVAPVVLVGAIIGGIAQFTDVLSKAVKSVGLGGATYRASAGGPTYDMPKLNGRTIDGCILRASEAAAGTTHPNNCNAPAQKFVASQFCREAAYSGAKTFETKFTGEFQKSYKLAQALAPDGRLNSIWNVDDSGAFIFVSITCEK